MQIVKNWVEMILIHAGTLTRPHTLQSLNPYRV